MSSKNKNVCVVDVLSADVCRLIIGHLSALACAEEYDILLEAGISKANIRSLKRLSYEDVWRLAQLSDKTVDVKALLKNVFAKEVPEEYLPYLLHGASNKWMEHYFRVNAAKCSKWREDLEVEKPFRARCLPTNKALAIIMERLQALCKTYSPTSIPAQELLSIAQEYQVSLGALWVELEKWDLEK